MGIKKEKLLPSGATGNYWKITAMIVDRLSMKVSWSIALFLNEEISKQVGAYPLWPAGQFVAPVTAEDLKGDLIALGYEVIKARASAAAEAPFEAGGGSSPGISNADLAGGENI